MRLKLDENLPASAATRLRALRVTISRRDHLIRLGLASRRRPGASAAEDPLDDPDAPAPLA